MNKRILLLISVAGFFAAATMLAQGPQAPQNREAPVSDVPFERILKANQEPANWLTYGGSLNSQRHSELTQITPHNARDLELKGVFQARAFTVAPRLRSIRIQAS